VYNSTLKVTFISFRFCFIIYEVFSAGGVYGQYYIVILRVEAFTRILQLSMRVLLQPERSRLQAIQGLDEQKSSTIKLIIGIDKSNQPIIIDYKKIASLEITTSIFKNTNEILQSQCSSNIQCISIFSCQLVW